VTGLQIRPSEIPIEAIYNPEIEKIKRAERDSGLEPIPLTFVVLKNK